jgi:PAS domain S-box-containing protein
MSNDFPSADRALPNKDDPVEQLVARRTSALEQQIAEGKHVESDLRWKTAFLEAQVNSTLDGLLVVGPGRQLLLLNQRLIDLWNIPARVIKENSCSALLEHVLTIVKSPEQFRERVEFLYDHPAESGHDEFELLTGVIIERHSSSVLGKDGQYYGRLWTYHDITERKRTEQALVAAKEILARERQMLRVLIDNIPDYMYVKDADSRFLLANCAVARQMGAPTPDALIGKTDFDFYPPELAKTFFEDEQRVIHSGQAEINREESGLDTYGNLSQVLTTQVPLHDSTGKVIGLVGIGRDITAIKNTEDALRRTTEALNTERQVLRTLIDNIPDYMFVKDTQSRFVVANTALAAKIGMKSSEELIGKTESDFAPPELARDFYALEQHVIQTKLPLLNSEVHGLDRQGGDVWVSVSNVPLFDERGEVTSIVGVARDISERKRVENALMENAARLNAIFNAVQTGILVIDAQTHCIVDANPLALRMIGLPREQVLGHECHKFVCSAQRGYCPITDLCEYVDNSERTLLTAFGESRPIIKSVVPVMINGREHFVEGFIDITQRKQIEQELQTAKEAAEAANRVSFWPT